MADIKIYLDEDVHPFIVDALRLRGWHALTTVEAQRRSSTDREQLAFATANGCALLTYNSNDFPRIHYETLAAGEHHAGIIVAAQDDPRRNVRAMLNLVATLSAEALQDGLAYLNNWAFHQRAT